MERRRLKLLLIPILLFCLNCSENNVKFDSEKWKNIDGNTFHLRIPMVNDLQENYLKEGTSYDDLITLLGHSDGSYLSYCNIKYEKYLSYTLELKLCGIGIDPCKGKNLIVVLSSDSTYVSSEIVKWRI